MTNYRNMKILLIYIKEHILIYKVDSKRERIWTEYQLIIFYLRFLQGNGDICVTYFLYKSLIIISFARSITDVSIEARYICVVAMES